MAPFPYERASGRRIAARILLLVAVAVFYIVGVILVWRAISPSS